MGSEMCIRDRLFPVRASPRPPLPILPGVASAELALCLTGLAVFDFETKLLLFYPTPYMTPLHHHYTRVKGQSAVKYVFVAEACERGCATQPTGQSAVYSLFAADARECGYSTHPTPMCLLIPNQKDETYLPRNCIVSFMVPSWSFHGLPWLFQRVFSFGRVPTRTLLLLAAVNLLVGARPWLCHPSHLDVPPHPKPEI